MTYNLNDGSANYDVSAVDFASKLENEYKYVSRGDVLGMCKTS